MKEIIITSSVLIVCILLVRRFFREKISSRMQYALWLLVALRLVVPSSAQIRMAVGSIEEFRVMDLVESWESRVGDVEEQLNQPVVFTMSLDNTVAGNLIARFILGMDVSIDGPTSVFFAGRPGFGWIDVLRGIWIGGMAVVALWMIAANMMFWHKLHKGRREFVLPGELESLLGEKNISQESEWRIRKRRKIKIYLSDVLASPCLYGCPGREAIYLTPDVAENTDKLRHVLIHEMCHKKHGDSFWSILRSTLVTVYWMNPLVWAAAVLSRRDCELACDEEALLMLGEEERISYGETLLSIITRKGRLSDIACVATTMTGSGKSVKERIKYIAEKPKVLGVAVATVLVFIIVVSVLVFTRNPQFSGETWEAGELSVISGDMQVILPETIAKISTYHTEEEKGDLIICQASSGMEVGRFCTLSYGSAVMLAEAGREIVPLGDYGQNSNLKQYMNFLNGGVLYDNGPTEVTMHTYTPYDGTEDNSAARHDDSDTTGHEFAEESIAGSEGVPGTDSNQDETTYVIEDESWSVMPLDESISTTVYQPVEETEMTEEAETSYDYLPNEEIITTTRAGFLGSASNQCYIYVKADYTEADENDLEEMEYINGELENVADRVIITSIYQAVREEMFEALSENRTEYLGDASKVGALVYALPYPDGLAYQEMTLHTAEGETPALDIHYKVDPENVADIDPDIVFFDAVMLFATIRNLEECNFIMDDGTGAVYNEIDNAGSAASEKESQGMLGHYETMATESINYKRTDLEEEFGILWSEKADQEGSYGEWIEDLCTQVVNYLH